jgi:hypothetical protein
MRETPRRENTHPGNSGGEGQGAATLPAPERKGIYLRTVYPLNPGIPHYLDFPQGER